MKKGFFNAIIVSALLLLAGGGLFLGKSLQNQEVKEAKAETVQITLNFNSLRSDTGTVNQVNVKFNETDIPVNTTLTQVSEDGFWINGVPTYSDGMAQIEKVHTYNHFIYIDRINYNKYHDYLQAGDIILLQGKWTATSGETTYDITVIPLCLKWNGSAWEKQTTYEFSPNLTLGSSNNKADLRLNASSENPIPYNGDWTEKCDSTSQDIFKINGSFVAKNTQLLKLTKYQYAVATNDVQAINDGDIMVIQGTFAYPKEINHVSRRITVREITVAWNGSTWQTGEQYFAEHFLAAGLCNNGVTAPNSSLWGGLATTFGYLGSNAAAEFKNAQYTISGDVVTPAAGVSQEMAEAAARYDYIVTKYGSEAYNDFANRFDGAVVPPASNGFELIFNHNYNANIIILACLSAVIASAVALFFIIRRQRKVTK